MPSAHESCGKKNNLSWAFFTDASRSVQRVRCGMGISGYCILSKRDAAFMCLSERLAPSNNLCLSSLFNFSCGIQYGTGLAGASSNIFTAIRGIFKFVVMHTYWKNCF